MSGKARKKEKDPEIETSRRFQTSRREEKNRMRRYAPVRTYEGSHGI